MDGYQLRLMPQYDGRMGKICERDAERGEGQGRSVSMGQRGSENPAATERLQWESFSLLMSVTGRPRRDCECTLCTRASVSSRRLWA